MIGKMDVNYFLKQLLLLFVFVVKLGTFIGFAIQNDIFWHHLNYIHMHYWWLTNSCNNVHMFRQLNFIYLITTCQHIKSWHVNYIFPHVFVIPSLVVILAYDMSSTCYFVGDYIYIFISQYIDVITSFMFGLLLCPHIPD
jgi:hypothetical protein